MNGSQLILETSRKEKTGRWIVIKKEIYNIAQNQSFVQKEIERAILASDIGITPNNDGKVIRLNFPELNEERRKELVKDIKKMGEEYVKKQKKV